MIRNQSPIRSSPRLPPNNPFAIEEFSGRIAQPIAGEFISPKFAILRKKFLCQFKNRPANSCSPMMPVQLSLVKSLGTAVKADDTRSEEHTSELQSLMRISYAVFCLKKKKRR